MKERLRASVRTSAHVLHRPFVHPWMVAAPDDVQHAVDRLDELIPRLRTCLDGVGIAADAPARVALLEALGVVRDGLDGLADAVRGHGPAVAQLRGGGLFTLRELRRHTDALSEADLRCRHAFEQARGLLPERSDLLAAVGGRYAEPRDLAQVTARARTEIADVPPQDRPQRLRGALDAVPTDALPALLARHPDLATVLTGQHDESAPAWLEPVVVRDVDDARDPAASLRTVGAVRAACEQASPDELARAAALHPRLVGGLDGAPLAARRHANRALIRAELERCRHTDAEFEQLLAASRDLESGSVVRRLHGQLLDAWLARDEITSVITVPHERPIALRNDLRARVTHYQQLLHDRVDQGRDLWRHRQVLLFDGAGPGRIAEMWGLLDEQTRQVAVYVGGTGTTARQFGWPTGIGRALARTDPSGRTAVVVWMGAEFPSAIGSHAPFARYARDAGQPLRDHVEALDVPAGIPITLVGHSYGGAIIGAAERLGVRADRVVHAGVPGVGPGVRDVQDYPSVDALGRYRDVQRYALTAPGDLIRLWQRSDEPISRISIVGARRAPHWIADHTLGADPTRLAGVQVLDTGIWETDRADRATGEILHGPRGHADVVEPGTTAFRRIAAIVAGDDPQAVEPPDVPTFRVRST